MKAYLIRFGSAILVFAGILLTSWLMFDHVRDQGVRVFVRRAPESPPGPPWPKLYRRCPGLKVQISILNKPSRDKIVVDAAVTNSADEECGWDKEFAVFCSWHVFNSDTGIALRPVHVAKIDRDKADIGRERFVKLEPKQTLRKRFEITKAIRVFSRKTGILGAGDFHGRRTIGYEETERIRIPDSMRSVVISLEYHASDGPRNNGFGVWFGYDPETVGMREGETESQELVINFP